MRNYYFQTVDPERHREIASKGGKAAHALGTAHKWTSEEAQAAGRKGGTAKAAKNGAGWAKGCPTPKRCGEHGCTADCWED